MPIRNAQAEWHGPLQGGSGKISFSGFEGAYSAPSRFEEAPGTNPEELLGAAHAGCFSMALAAGLSRAGFNPESVKTGASVHLSPAPQGGFRISKIELSCEAQVAGISPEDFESQAQAAKSGCPVSQALAGVEITLKAQLV
jgi:osmotically inducible protein OsmC